MAPARGLPQEAGQRLPPLPCARPPGPSALRAGWVGLDRIGLDWIGLGWVGLGWIGLDWGLDWMH